MGWSLQQAECQLVPEHLAWQCAAQYQQGYGAIDDEGFLISQQWQTQAQMVDLSTFRLDFSAVQLETQHWVDQLYVKLLQFLVFMHKQHVALYELIYQQRKQRIEAWQ